MISYTCFFLAYQFQWLVIGKGETKHSLDFIQNLSIDSVGLDEDRKQLRHWPLMSHHKWWLASRCVQHLACRSQAAAKPDGDGTRLRMFFNLCGIRKQCFGAETRVSWKQWWAVGYWSLGWVGISSREGWPGIIRVGKVLRTMTFFMEKGSGE